MSNDRRAEGGRLSGENTAAADLRDREGTDEGEQISPPVQVH